MKELELEKTYLAKYIPADIEKFESKELLDIYFPKESEHPKLRLRKKGLKFEITKKQPVKEGDASMQIEHTIELTKEEFEELAKIEGKRVHKIRYLYKYNEIIAEFDIFKDDLEGLVVVDFEFKTEEEKDNFQIPDFCLIEVTQEDFIAGGMLCGKKYDNIESELERFNYKKLFIK